ncbi:hypothetical protein GQ42DRAFT_181283 [Ramicandelaber brevisporus]|nr:hypothetical protein GQ42DRAFT_181283 [Ramicandelaber brevisporus]
MSPLRLLLQIAVIVSTVFATADTSEPHPRGPVTHVIGGVPAGSKELPFLVRISFATGNMASICSGVLITADTVLSAGHCAYNKGSRVGLDAYTIVAGSNTLLNGRPTGPGVVSRRVVSINPYPAYDPSRTGHDLALFTVYPPFPMTEFIGTARITSDRPSPGEAIVAAGWGIASLSNPTANSPGGEGVVSSRLMKTSLIVGNRRRCEQAIPQFNPMLMVCTDDSANAHGTCNGDSGGPLMYYDQGLRSYLVIGTTSFKASVDDNVPTCGGSNTVHAFTRLTPYLPWIASTARVGQEALMRTSSRQKMADVTQQPLSSEPQMSMPTPMEQQPSGIGAIVDMLTGEVGSAPQTNTEPELGAAAAAATDTAGADKPSSMAPPKAHSSPFGLLTTQLSLILICFLLIEMEQFPPEFVLHHYPLLGVFGATGLVAHTSDAQTATATTTGSPSTAAAVAVSESGGDGVQSSPEIALSPGSATRPRASDIITRFESQNAQQLGRQLLQYLTSKRPTASSAPVTFWDASKPSANGSISAFRIATFGASSSLPPKRAALSAEPSAASVSTLSPWHPESPVYSNGLIPPAWLQRHRDMIPSVMLSLHEMWHPSFDNPLMQGSARPSARPASQTASGGVGGDGVHSKIPERDAALVMDIIDKKKAANERGVSLVVVIILHQALYDDPLTEDRLAVIRRNVALESHHTLFTLRPGTAAQFAEFASAIDATLCEAATTYFRNHSRRIKRKITKLAEQTAVPPMPQNYSNLNQQQQQSMQRLPASGWLARYNYKLAVFAEMRQDNDGASQLYSLAATSLLNHLRYLSTAQYLGRKSRALESERTQYSAVLSNDNSSEAPSTLPPMARLYAQYFLRPELSMIQSGNNTTESAIVDMLTRAYERFKHLRAHRTTTFLAAEIANTYMTAGKFAMAIKFYQRIIRVYRREGWPMIAGQLLQNLAHSIEQLQQQASAASSAESAPLSDLAITQLELVSITVSSILDNQIKYIAALEQTLTKLLPGQIINVDAESIYSPIVCTAHFAQPNATLPSSFEQSGNDGALIPYQVVLAIPSGSSSISTSNIVDWISSAIAKNSSVGNLEDGKLPISCVHVAFSDSTHDFTINTDSTSSKATSTTSSTDDSSNVSIIDVSDLSTGALPSLSVRAGGLLVLSCALRVQQPSIISIQTVTLTIGHSTSAQIRLQFRTADRAASVPEHDIGWISQDCNGRYNMRPLLTSRSGSWMVDVIRPAPKCTLQVKPSQVQHALIGHPHLVSLAVDNQESAAADLTVSVQAEQSSDVSTPSSLLLALAKESPALGSDAWLPSISSVQIEQVSAASNLDVHLWLLFTDSTVAASSVSLQIRVDATFGSTVHHALNCTHEVVAKRQFIAESTIVCGSSGLDVEYDSNALVPGHSWTTNRLISTNVTNISGTDIEIDPSSAVLALNDSVPPAVKLASQKGFVASDSKPVLLHNGESYSVITSVQLTGSGPAPASLAAGFASLSLPWRLAGFSNMVTEKLPINTAIIFSTVIHVTSDPINIPPLQQQQGPRVFQFVLRVRNPTSLAANTTLTIESSDTITFAGPRIVTNHVMAHDECTVKINCVALRSGKCKLPSVTFAAKPRGIESASFPVELQVANHAQQTIDIPC